VRAAVVFGAGVIAVAMLGLGAFLSSCNAVLGIQEAMLDPDGGTTARSPEASGDDGSAGAALYALNCDNYCSLMSANCGPSAQNGDNTEYLTGEAGVCSTMCKVFESTSEVTTAVHEPATIDSLNCRVWHANAAASDPHTHCPHAGPLGGDLCGNDPCIPFCRMDTDFCTGNNAAYSSYEDCLSACDADGGYAGFPYEISTTDNEVADLGFQSASNTLNCRIYHLQNFLKTGEAIHCTHTSRDGNGVCTSPDGG
jgi:hypothetical protein